MTRMITSVTVLGLWCINVYCWPARLDCNDIVVLTRTIAMLFDSAEPVPLAYDQVQHDANLLGSIAISDD